jgi:hypothetical protein
MGSQQDADAARLRLVHDPEAPDVSARRAALAASLVTAAALTGGCGGSGRGDAAQTGTLTWTATPQVFRTRTLPDDRVAVGTVRNTGSRPLRLSAAALTVRTTGGSRLRSTGQFASGFAHGLYGAFQKPDPIPPGELTRLGLAVTIAPGRSAPLAVSWHQPRRMSGAPVVDYGAGRLPLPTRVRMGEGGL